MITLITGGPGLGKSALAIKLIQEHYADRTLYSNIDSLTLDHEPLPLLKDWTKPVENAQGTVEYEFTFPPNSLIVIDECQKFYRPRSTSAAVPPHVQAFETHRHGGVDFILITQGTHLIDFNIKTLVKGGKHIYLKSTFLGRFSYEAKQCIAVDDKADLANAARKRYKLPKEVFPLYKSAEVHTKPPKVAIPLPVYVLGAILLTAPFIGWFIYHRMQERIHPQTETAAASPVSPGQVQKVLLSSMSYSDSLIPADSSNPRSAPIYQDDKPVITPPQVVGCVATVKKCVCYTQQSTRIALPLQQCFERVAGLYYDPYQAPVVTSPPLAAQSEQKSGSGQGGIADRPKPDLKSDENKQADIVSMHYETNLVNTKDL